MARLKNENSENIKVKWIRAAAGATGRIVAIFLGPTFGKRHIQIILLFFAACSGFAMRSIMSVAVVAMTTKSSTNPDIPIFDWDNTSVILSSFFWGYPWLQILVGHYGLVFGIKYIFLVLFSLNTLFFTLIPTAAIHFGSAGVIVCRILQGLTQGCLIPTVNSIIGVWTPVEERTKTYSFVYSGYGLGSMLGSFACGYISDSKFGWPKAFYVFGPVGIIFSIMWGFFAHNSPACHPYITLEEKKYIENSLQKIDDQKFPTPWKKIFTNVPFYSVFVAYCGFNFTYAMNTEMPTYLSNVWKFDTATVGLLNSVPTCLFLILSVPLASVADYLIANRYLSTGHIRKLFECVGDWGLLISTAAYCLVPDDKRYIVVILLAINSVFSAFCTSGAAVNLTDLSPRFSGVMAAFCNATSQIFTASAPLLVQLIVNDKTDRSQWNIVFIICAAVLVASSTVFAIFGSGERQPWDGTYKSTKDIDRIKKISIISIG